MLLQEQQQQMPSFDLMSEDKLNLIPSEELTWKLSNRLMVLRTHLRLVQDYIKLQKEIAYSAERQKKIEELYTAYQEKHRNYLGIIAKITNQAVPQALTEEYKAIEELEAEVLVSDPSLKTVSLEEAKKSKHKPFPASDRLKMTELDPELKKSIAEVKKNTDKGKKSSDSKKSGSGKVFSEAYLKTPQGMIANYERYHNTWITSCDYIIVGLKSHMSFGTQSEIPRFDLIAGKLAAAKSRIGKANQANPNETLARKLESMSELEVIRERVKGQVSQALDDRYKELCESVTLALSESATVEYWKQTESGLQAIQRICKKTLINPDNLIKKIEILLERIANPSPVDKKTAPHDNFASNPSPRLSSSSRSTATFFAGEVSQAEKQKIEERFNAIMDSLILVNSGDSREAKLMQTVVLCEEGKKALENLYKDLEKKPKDGFIGRWMGRVRREIGNASATLERLKAFSPELVQACLASLRR